MQRLDHRSLSSINLTILNNIIVILSPQAAVKLQTPETNTTSIIDNKYILNEKNYIVKQ